MKGLSPGLWWFLLPVLAGKPSAVGLRLPCRLGALRLWGFPSPVVAQSLRLWDSASYAGWEPQAVESSVYSAFILFGSIVYSELPVRAMSLRACAVASRRLWALTPTARASGTHPGWVSHLQPCSPRHDTCRFAAGHSSLRPASSLAPAACLTLGFPRWMRRAVQTTWGTFPLQPPWYTASCFLSSQGLGGPSVAVNQVPIGWKS